MRRRSSGSRGSRCTRPSGPSRAQPPEATPRPAEPNEPAWVSLLWVFQASGERIPARRLAGLPENVARLGRVDERLGILLEEEPLLDELIRRLRDRPHEAGVALVALLERSARVAVREPLGLRLRKRNERTAEAAEVRRPEPGTHVPAYVRPNRRARPHRLDPCHAGAVRIGPGHQRRVAAAVDWRQHRLDSALRAKVGAEVQDVDGVHDARRRHAGDRRERLTESGERNERLALEAWIVAVRWLDVLVTRASANLGMAVTESNPTARDKLPFRLDRNLMGHSSLFTGHAKGASAEEHWLQPHPALSGWLRMSSRAAFTTCVGASFCTGKSSDRRRKRPRAGLINEINMMLGWI